MSRLRAWSVLAVLAIQGCALDTRGVPLGDDDDGGGQPPDATASTPDAEPGDIDAADIDAAPIDAPDIDAMPIDAMPIDAMPIDAMPIDAMPIDAPMPTCPAGYTAGYRFVGSTETATFAAADCADDLAGKTHLVIIDDATERDVVDTLSGSRDVWIGLTDAASENTFLTVLGDPAPYVNWGTNQPDNFFEEDCVEMQNGGAFNDADCATVDRRYVCECDLTLP